VSAVDADETTIEQLEGDVKRLRDALLEIARRARRFEDRPWVVAEIARRALHRVPGS
jgi:hypothetical protein